MSEHDTYKIIESLLPTLITLEEYDKNRLNILPKNKELWKLNAEFAYSIIFNTKKFLAKNNEYVEDFGVDTDKNLEKIIINLYQEFGGEELYPFMEDKAANLLYMVIKNHPFVDGNKRSAVTLFKYYLYYNYYIHYHQKWGYGYQIDKVGNIVTERIKTPLEWREIAKPLNIDITSLALQIALSRPEDKDIQIQLIIKLIQQSFREFYE